MDSKMKHLELIQGVVNRLASNSFRLKGWAVVLISAMLVLLAREGLIKHSFICILPILVLWGLDGYFLWQERLYRCLYDDVRRLNDDEVDFSMRIDSLNETWLGSTFSRTLVPFYTALVFLVCLVVFFLKP